MLFALINISLLPRVTAHPGKDERCQIPGFASNKDEPATGSIPETYRTGMNLVLDGMSSSDYSVADRA